MLPIIVIFAFCALLIQIFALHNKVSDNQDEINDLKQQLRNLEHREDNIIDMFIKKEDAASN